MENILKYRNIEISKYRGGRGVAVLPLVIISSSIVLIIGAAVAFVTFYENQSAFSARKADEAMAAAQAGVNDALQKIIYNRNFSSVGYGLAVGGASTTVAVTAGSDCLTVSAKESFTVVSTGIAHNSRKRIQALVSHNCGTGQITVTSIREVEI